MSDVLQQLDDSWLELDDEDYFGEEGMLADTAMDPLDQAQAVAEENKHSSMEPTGISDTIPTCSLQGTSTTQPHNQPQAPTALRPANHPGFSGIIPENRLLSRCPGILL